MSEFFSNSASALISVLYNWQLLRFAGEEGVAVYGTIMYVAMIFMAVSIGYTMGCAPLISYQYGAGNRKEQTSLTRKSLAIIAAGSVLMFGASELLADPLAHLFAGYDPYLMEMTIQAFRYCSPVFLFSGMAIFGSGFFTALNYGPVSAMIAMLRTLVFQTSFILIFPMIWGLNGIWSSMAASEAMAMLTLLYLIYRYRNKYGYFCREDRNDRGNPTSKSSSSTSGRGKLSPVFI